jgi:hypothetical protein
MRRTEVLQGIRQMKFEEIFDRTARRELSQAEAASILGMSDRTFRRWRDRFEANGAEGLYDRRLGKISARRVLAELQRGPSDAPGPWSHGQGRKTRTHRRHGPGSKTSSWPGSVPSRNRSSDAARESLFASRSSRRSNDGPGNLGCRPSQVDRRMCQGCTHFPRVPSRPGMSAGKRWLDRFRSFFTKSILSPVSPGRGGGVAGFTFQVQHVWGFQGRPRWVF